MSDDALKTPPHPLDDIPEPRVSRARIAGRVAQGILLGLLLLPALFKLASLAGDISPFKYQGF